MYYIVVSTSSFNFKGNITKNEECYTLLSANVYSLRTGPLFFWRGGGGDKKH